MTCSRACPDVTVIIRYPDGIRRAVIRRNRHRPSIHRTLKSGRREAQQWHVIEWIDKSTWRDAETIADRGA